MGRSINDGLDAHVDARQPLAVRHVRGGRIVGMLMVLVVVVLLLMVRVGMVRGVGGMRRAKRGREGAGAAGCRVALRSVCGLVVLLLLVVLVVLLWVVVTAVRRHGVGAAVAPDRVRVAATARRVVRAPRRGGAAVRCVELVIYWCQTDAGDSAVVVIPMHWMTARLEALPA